MKKILLTILLIIVVAGVSGGGVYLWQKGIFDKEKASLANEINNLQKQNSETVSNNTTMNQPTNGLNTYTNTKYGYTLKYPAGLDVMEAGMISKEADSQSNVITFVDNADKIQNPVELLDLQIIQNDKNLTLKDFISTLAINFSEKAQNPINDYETKRISFTAEEKEDVVYIKKEQNIFEFNITNTKDRDIAESILSSFQAIK